MQNTKNFFIHFTKGFIVGIGTLIPGISGGTTAIILDIFEDIINAFSNIFKTTKKSVSFLFPIGLGAVLGIYFLTPYLNAFCEINAEISKIVFCILSLISTTFFVLKVIIGKSERNSYIYLFFGILCAILIFISVKTIQLNSIDDNFITLLVIGIILSLALVLPAISFSYMLLFFGIYQKTLLALETFDVIFLIPLIMGIAFGSFVFSKILSKILYKHPSKTYSFVFGFVICSIVEIIL